MTDAQERNRLDIAAPLASRSRWRLSGRLLWIAALAAVIAYGSLLPFSFDARSGSPGHGPSLARLSWQRPTFEDFVVNLWLYVPLGAALALAWPGRPGPAARRGPHDVVCRAAAGALLGFALSLVIEWAQTAIPERVGSWMDVALNAAGAGIGAGFGLRWSHALVRGMESTGRRLMTNPTMTLAAALTVAVILYVAAPFDFITSTYELHAAFRRVRWDLWPDARYWSAGSAARAALLGAWIMLVGFCTARGRIRDGWSPGQALASAVKHGLLVAILLQIVSLVRPGPYVHAWAAAWMSVFAAAGAVAGARRADPDPRAEDARTRVAHSLTRAPHLGLGGLGVLLGLSQIVNASEAFALDPAASAATGAGVLPFERLWRLPVQHLLGTLVSEGLAYALVTVCIVIAARRWLERGAGPLAVIITTVLALSVEVLPAAARAHRADLTDPVVAAAVALATAAMLHRLRGMAAPAGAPT